MRMTSKRARQTITKEKEQDKETRRTQREVEFLTSIPRKRERERDREKIRESRTYEKAWSVSSGNLESCARNSSLISTRPTQC